MGWWRFPSGDAALPIAAAAARTAAVAVVLSFLQAASILLMVAANVPPALALGGSFAVLVAASAGWAHLRRRRRSATFWVRWIVPAVVAGLLSGVTYLRPCCSGPTPTMPGSQLVQLRDGEEIAVRRYGPARPTDAPVVLVHGGPGVPLSRAEEDAMARLADTRTVVSYDQVGVGGSSRLEKASAYTLQRAVDDLAAVVAATTDSEPVLLGHSWGTLIALTYAAQNPGKTAGLVLTSPGPFPWRGRSWPAVAPQDRLGPGDRARLYAEALEPRNFFIYALTAVDPDTAQWFAGDQEMERRFARLYRLAQLGLTCEHTRHQPPEALGYYAAQVPQLHPDGTGVNPTQVEGLATLPVLVIRGRCDYIEANIARTYAEELSARLVNVTDAGHSIAEEQPGTLLSVINTFLDRVQTGIVDRKAVR